MSDLERFRTAVTAWAVTGVEEPRSVASARSLAPRSVRAVVLVEGVSDRRAVEALAFRRGRDLDAEGVCVLSTGGAMGVHRYARVLHELDVPVHGLCDAAEERYFDRALADHGPRTGLNDAPASSGVHVCVADLEDELVRALGVAGVERVLAAGDDLHRFRAFQRQPAQRERTAERQLRRFMGTTSGRKARYARALVLALDPDRVPAPLDRLLASV